MATSDIGRTDIRHHLHPYSNFKRHEKEGPFIITRGDGIWVYDEHGNKYLEGLAGLWCVSLGFSNERLIAAAKSRGITTLIDGAQAVSHMHVDVQELGCDFYAFYQRTSDVTAELTRRR